MKDGIIREIKLEMISSETIKRYIQLLDEVIDSGNVADAEELQNEILAVFSTDIRGLKRGLTNYGFIAAFSDGRRGKTTILGDNPDFIKDARLLRSRLQVELEKVEVFDMRSLLSAFPTEKMVLRKQDGSTTEVTAFVSSDKILTEDVNVVIEEGADAGIKALMQA